MKIQQADIDQIKIAFDKMQSREDFIYLLNVVNPLVCDEKENPFGLKQLMWYSNPKLAVNRYIEFKVKKKSGDYRTINAPVEELKLIQKTLSFVLQCVFGPHKAAMGFVRDKSIVDNAKIHAGSRYVYNIDLKDFFSSIDQARVWKCLQLKPFNLAGEITSQFIIGSSGWVSEKKIGRKDIANIIASLCCTEMEVERKNANGEWIKVKRNVLPQGAPTSPIITNVICYRLDYLLTAVAKRFGLKYSRYADDITFSSMHNVFQQDGEFLKELHRIILEQGFHIKESKTRLQKEGFRQEVTGLLVNEKVNVQKRYIKQLREWLYKWETYGYNKANSFFIQNYLKEKGNVKKGIPNMTMVIDGKLQYLKMVKGEKDGTYVKLKERFDALYAKTSPINLILDIWENEGIDKAMEVFYLNKVPKKT